MEGNAPGKPDISKDCSLIFVVLGKKKRGIPQWLDTNVINQQHKISLPSLQ